MKVALAYSGQPRNIKKTWSNHKKYLIEPLKKQGHEVDIFCHFWFDDKEVGKEYISGSYLIGKIENSKKFVFENIKTASLTFEKPQEFNEINLIPDKRFPHPINRTFSMFKSWNNVASQISDYETKNNFEYDLMFRMRTDLVFHKIFSNISEFNLNNLYVLDKYAHLDYGVDDTFAFSNSSNIKSYLKIEENLNEIINQGAAINPETLLGFYLNNFLGLNVVRKNFQIKLFRVSYLKYNKIRFIGNVQKYFYYLFINWKSNLKKLLKHWVKGLE